MPYYSSLLVCMFVSSSVRNGSSSSTCISQRKSSSSFMGPILSQARGQVNRRICISDKNEVFLVIKISKVKIRNNICFSTENSNGYVFVQLLIVKVFEIVLEEPI